MSSLSRKSRIEDGGEVGRVEVAQSLSVLDPQRPGLFFARARLFPERGVRPVLQVIALGIEGGEAAQRAPQCHLVPRAMEDLPRMRGLGEEKARPLARIPQFGVVGQDEEDRFLRRRLRFLFIL